MPARSARISKPPNERPPTPDSIRWISPPPRPPPLAFPLLPSEPTVCKPQPPATSPGSIVTLRQTETALLSEAGLPNRPWYRHTIYAPGEYTGYSAVVIPGVNEAIDAHNANLAAQQLTVLTQALTRAAQTLEGAR